MKKEANIKKRDGLQKVLRELGNGFLRVVKEEVDSAVLLCDAERLDRLISIFHIHMDSEVVRVLREKGFDKELRELCDRAGKK